MVSIDQCTVRYLLCGINSAYSDFVHDFKEFIYCDYNKGWLPEMLINNDGEYVWAYFTYQLTDAEKRLIGAFTPFDLIIEERLV